MSDQDVIPYESVQVLVRALISNTQSLYLTDHEQRVIDDLPSDMVLSILADMFDTVDNDDIQARAYEAILRLTHVDHVVFLIDRLETNGSWRAAIGEDLTLFPDARSTPPLINVLLHDPDPDLRYVAADSLGAIGTVAALDALEYAASHDDGEDYEMRRVADMAREAIIRIRTRLLIEDDIGR